MAYGTSKPTVHTDLFLALNKELEAEDFDVMKGVVKAKEFGNFKPGELQRIKSLQELLEKLEHKNVIKVGDYRKLKQIMEKIDKPDVIEIIRATEDQLRKEGHKIPKDFAESASSSRYEMDTEPPPALNTNNSRRLPQSASFEDAMPSDIHVPVQAMDVTDTAGGRDDKPRYPVGRGYVLFINNFVKHAQGKSYLREGCKIDAGNIEKLFDDSLNYKFVREEDLTKPKLKEILQDTKMKLKDGGYARFILIICSHGEQVVVKNDNKEFTEERIMMVDGESITEDELTAPFMRDELKDFSGKPKVFIVQACRSPKPPDVADDLTEDRTRRSRIDPVLGPPSLTRPINADVLISYATTKGTKAWRNEIQGSWYIHHFCEILRKRYKKEHLMDLLVRVNDEVADMESTVGAAKQMPCQVSTLTKHIWL